MKLENIECEVGILPRSHGSALFTRGETQAIVATTFGTAEDEQKIESLEGMVRSRFMFTIIFHHFQLERLEGSEQVEEKLVTVN